MCQYAKPDMNKYEFKFSKICINMHQYALYAYLCIRCLNMHKGKYVIMCKLKYVQICKKVQCPQKYVSFVHLFEKNMQKYARNVSMKFICKIYKNM